MTGNDANRNRGSLDERMSPFLKARAQRERELQDSPSKRYQRLIAIRKRAS